MGELRFVEAVALQVDGRGEVAVAALISSPMSSLYGRGDEGRRRGNEEAKERKGQEGEGERNLRA